MCLHKNCNEVYTILWSMFLKKKEKLWLMLMRIIFWNGLHDYYVQKELEWKQTNYYIVQQGYFKWESDTHVSCESNQRNVVGVLLSCKGRQCQEMCQGKFKELDLNIQIIM